MTANLLFWDTNMATVTSRENTLDKIICSIKGDNFFFSVSSAFATEDHLKGVAVMCHFATPTERDQLSTEVMTS